MKKIILIVAVVLLSIPLLQAQSDCSTAVTASIGTNTFEGVTDQYYWFKYELAAGKELVIRSSNEGFASVSSGSCELQNDGDTFLFLNFQYSSLVDGGTVFIAIRPTNTETVTFDLSTENLTTGDNWQLAETATEGINSFTKTLVRTENSIYYGTYWYKFDLPASKKITVSASEGGSKQIIAGENLSDPTYYAPDYDNVNAIFSQFVDGGVVYIVIDYCCTSFTDTYEFTLTVEDLEPGDNCVFAANAQLGTNTFQAYERKRQWYTYDLPVSKKITINSNNSGSVSFGKGGSSHPTIFDCTFDGNLVGNQISLPSADYTGVEDGGTVYFAIYPDATEAFEFEVVVSDFEPGDICSLPVTALEGPNTFTVQEHTSYWFTYDLPAGKKLSVNPTSNAYMRYEISSGPDCDSRANFAQGFNDAITYTEVKTGGPIFIEVLDPTFSEEVSFDFTISDYAPGEICSNPVQATTALNSFNSVADKSQWYTFNLTTGKKLIYTSSNDADIEFYTGNDCQNLSSAVFSNSTTAVFSEYKTGGTVYFRILPYNTEVFEFSLTESDYETGDYCGLAAAANNGVNSFNATENTEYWYTYELPAGKKLSYSSLNDGPIQFYTGSGCEDISYFNGNSYDVIFKGYRNGGTVYFYILPYGTGTFTFTLTESDIVAGDVCDLPATANKGINTFTAVDDIDYWYTYEVPAGKKLTYSSSSFAAAFFLTGSDCDNLTTASDNNEGNEEEMVFSDFTNGGTIYLGIRSNSTGVVEFTLTESDLAAEPIDQSITFNALEATTFGATAFDLAATASSGLAVNYSSSNTSVATISGATVTIVGAGTTEITAAQSGNEEYNAATSALQTLTVNKADQSISIDVIADKEAEAAPFDVAASTSSDLALTYEVTGPATISGKTITLEGTEGTVNVTVSQAGNANYNAASEEVSFTVNEPKSDQTITISAIADKISDDAPFEVEATTTSGLALTYAVTGPATIEGTTLTLEGTAGVVEVIVSQAGNEEFNPATASVTFTVIEDSGLAGDINNDGVIGEGEIAGDIDEDGVIGEGEIAGDINGNGIIDVAENGRNNGGEIAGDINGDGEIGEGEIAGDISGDGIIGEGEAIGDVNGDGSITEGEVEGDADGNGELDDEESAVLSTTSILNFKVFPNPVVDHLRIQGINLNVEEVVITDLKGSVFIKQQNVNTSEGLDIRQLPTGVYLLHISSANINYHLKFMKN